MKGEKSAGYCVITGATGGFGQAFARRLATLGYDLCLTSRAAEKLEALKSELTATHAIQVDFFPLDLASEDSPRALLGFTRGRPVDLLVNCAGMSVGGFPRQAKLDDELRMIKLNLIASHALTRLFLDGMIARDAGKILNVASLSAWTPVPGIAAYSAGKAYILAFSQALDYELSRMGSAVTVSVVTPGFYPTEMGGSGYRIKSVGRSIERFAEVTLRDFLRGRRLIVPRQDALVPFLSKILPSRLMRGLAFKNLMDNLETEPTARKQGLRS